MIYFLRHTKVYNPDNLCYGQTDLPLDSSFELELNKIKETTNDIKFEKIYSSPLKRCKCLAEAISLKQISPIYDNRLMEMNFGLWEGKYWQDIYNTIEGKYWFDNYDYAKCPGGESFLDVTNRLKSLLREIAPINQNILIVTHAGIIRAMFKIKNNISVRESFDIPVEYGQLFKF